MGLKIGPRSDASNSGRRRIDPWAQAEGVPASARPLLRPTPRAAMFFPLVVIVAVLPGLYALNWWDLRPPGPWWGLRGLAVVEGRVVDQTPAADRLSNPIEARSFRAVAFQPPLYAWLEAAGYALSGDRSPMAAVVPSYIAGALVVLLVYAHGRLWRGSGIGLIAAVLAGFNHNLLVQMQEPSPATLGLAACLAVLLCYGQHLRQSGREASASPWGGGFLWVVLGGVALGGGLLAIGPVGLLPIPVVFLHQAYLRAGEPPVERSEHTWYEIWDNPSIVAGAIVLGIGLLVSAPWFAYMASHHGWAFADALLHPPDPLGGDRPGLLARLVMLAPATLPLGLYGVARCVRLALVADNDDRLVVGGVLWVVWLAVGAIAPALWPAGPQSALAIFLLVPLNLLAAGMIGDLAGRRVSARSLVWLAPATVVTIFWWLSQQLRDAVTSLMAGNFDTDTVLGLHLAFDLVLGVLIFTRRLDRWARRRDDRQRWVIAGFLFAVLATILADGMHEITFRHRETREILALRGVIARRHQSQPFESVTVVAPEAERAGVEGATPGGRLRYILHATLPGIPMRDLTSTDQLLALPPASGPRLVVLVSDKAQLPRAVQSQLSLEAIHPGGTGKLYAFATRHQAPASPATVRRRALRP